MFFNRCGQFIYREPRGRHAGYDVPEIGIHRGKLHRVLLRGGAAAAGRRRASTWTTAASAWSRTRGGVTLRFAGRRGRRRAPVRADVVIACDGVNSAVRRQFYPDEKLAFAGINTWRGVTVHKPILTGKSYLRIGSIETGKIVIYPIVDNVDGAGQPADQLGGRDPRSDGAPMNDWNKPGELEDFIADLRGLALRLAGRAGADRAAPSAIFEYPMVDKDPVPRWTFGRVTLLGDAAHPMYPRGSNGSAQALIDARTLADAAGAAAATPRRRWQRYEAVRLPADRARSCETNRTVPPDFIIMKVDELSGGKPFPGTIDDLISQDELRRISEDYKRSPASR